MRQTGARPAIFLACLALSAGANAQETQLGSDFRREGEEIRKDCASFTFKSVESCADTLFTDHPVHLAVGSIAPQDGFGFGPAFVAHWTPNESWRLSWDVDAVVSTNASWRAGAYMTAVWDRHRRIVVRPGGSGAGASNLKVQEYPVFHVLAQSISLNKLDYFGMGPDTSDTARSYFGMRETIAGVNATWPILPKWNVSLYGEANGRFVDVRPSSGQPDRPSSKCTRRPRRPVSAANRRLRSSAKACASTRMSPAATCAWIIPSRSRNTWQPAIPRSRFNGGPPISPTNSRSTARPGG